MVVQSNKQSSALPSYASGYRGAGLGLRVFKTVHELAFRVLGFGA